MGEYSGFCQKIDRVTLESSLKIFKDLSDGSDNFSLKYIEKDSLFVIQENKINEQISYQIKVKNIHPEGVYIDGNIFNSKFTLKLISINNHNSFIMTKVKGKSEFGEITNVVDLSPFKGKNKELSLKEFVKSFRAFLRIFNEKEESDEIFITTPKN